ncbi:hypothetical protein D2T81_08935, partial [Azospirillum brasilense]
EVSRAEVLSLSIRRNRQRIIRARINEGPLAGRVAFFPQVMNDVTEALRAFSGVTKDGRE